MNFFKMPPLGYVARLKDIRMINFTVPPAHLKPFIPSLPLVEVNGRAVISLLDVSLLNLRPNLLFNFFGFTYRHIAVRVLIKDGHLYDDNINRGIYYVQSFTDHSFVVNAGRILTNFNFSRAEFKEDSNVFSLRRGTKYLRYELDLENTPAANPWLKEMLIHVDRAYSVHNNKLKETKVRRNNLPLSEVNCPHFETNFFSDTSLLTAFQVREVLEYEWLPPRRSMLQANFMQPVFENKFC